MRFTHSPMVFSAHLKSNAGWPFSWRLRLFRSFSHAEQPLIAPTRLHRLQRISFFAGYFLPSIPDVFSEFRLFSSTPRVSPVTPLLSVVFLSGVDRSTPGASFAVSSFGFSPCGVDLFFSDFLRSF